MIYLATEIIGYELVSINNVAVVGRVAGILINHNYLNVAGFWMEIKLTKTKSELKILTPVNLRQIDKKRFYINDLNNLQTPKDLAKLKDVFRVDYQILGKKVISKQKERLGKVDNFTFNDDDYRINSIIVRPRFYKFIRAEQVTYTRKQIERIGHKQIIINTNPQQIKSADPLVA